MGMRASELIRKLQHLVERHGDREVSFRYNLGVPYPIGRRMPKPREQYVLEVKLAHDAQGEPFGGAPPKVIQLS